MIFFERRLNEVVMGMQPKAMRWSGERILINLHIITLEKRCSLVLLLIMCLATAISAYLWVMDEQIKHVSVLKLLFCTFLLQLCDTCFQKCSHCVYLDKFLRKSLEASIFRHRICNFISHVYDLRYVQSARLLW